MLSAEGIVRRIGRRTVLDRVSVAVRPGRVTALLGPNGAGKSTLIAALAGELKPHAGTVRIDGEPLAGLAPLDLARRRGVLPQSSTLAFGFAAREVVALGRLAFAGTAAARHDHAAIEAAGRAAGIAGLWHQPFATLSGGEQQRVHFARVMAQLWRPAPDGPPRYLLLDEPTAALDLAHRRAILGHVRRLADEGIGALAAVHDPTLALDHADDAVLMRGGRVIAAGPASAVVAPAFLEACFGVAVEAVTRADGRTAILA